MRRVLGRGRQTEAFRSVAVAAMAACCVLASGQPQSLIPGAPDPSLEPSAERILELALQRAKSNDDGGAELALESLVESTVETLSGDGAVVEVESVRRRRYPLAGEMYEELVARDGEELDEREARKEAKRRAAFVREARKRSARGEEFEPKDRRMRFDRKLMGRYRPVLTGTEEVRGYRCWVVAFAPRSGRLPSNGAMDRALNQSTGKLWILQSNYELARIVFEMQTPVRYFWGLFATLKQVDGRIDFDAVGSGIWLPSRFQLELDLSLLAGVKSVRRRIGIRWMDYQPVEVGAGAVAAGN